MNSIVERAIQTYGTGRQTIKAIEELHELGKELCKILDGQGNQDHLTEELADVQIMFWQVQAMYGVEDGAIDEVINYKLARLKRKLDQMEIEKEPEEQ